MDPASGIAAEQHRLPVRARASCSTATRRSWPRSTEACTPFVRSGEVWTQQQQLLAEHYAGNGIRLALEGDTALVGAPDENVGANRSQGAVFVYTRAGGVWTRRATLTATPGRASELFGFSLGFSDGTALVVGDEVYQFTRSGDTWISAALAATPAGTDPQLPPGLGDDRW